jgi:hypothetical protein
MLMHYFSCRVGPVRIPKIARWDTLRRTCVFHPVRSTGCIVHSGVSGVRNVDALFFMFLCAQCGFHKRRARICYPNLCFCIQCDLRFMLCILVRLDHEALMQKISCSGETGTDFTKSASGQVTPKLCSRIRCDMWVM